MARKSKRQSIAPQRLVEDTSWAIEPAGKWSSSAVPTVSVNVQQVDHSEEPAATAGCHNLLVLSSEPSMVAATVNPPSTGTAEARPSVTGFQWEPMELVNESGEVQVFFEPQSSSSKEPPAAIDLFG